MSRMVSPNEMLEAGIRIQLNGKDPVTKDDWALLFNFFATNLSLDVMDDNMSCLQVLRMIWDCPLTEQEVIQIGKFQRNLRLNSN